MLTIPFIEKAVEFLSNKHGCDRNLLDYVGIWEFPAREKKLVLFNIEDPASPSFRSTVAYELTLSHSL
jgi:hypothetical protein